MTFQQHTTLTLLTISEITCILGTYEFFNGVIGIDDMIFSIIHLSTTPDCDISAVVSNAMTIYGLPEDHYYINDMIIDLIFTPVITYASHEQPEALDS
uniref:Uncharacterized protein n=1 Tax=viral metagenome TaxID=1070528 RepID=A0A6C0J7Q4_9ZZZZ